MDASQEELQKQAEERTHKMAMMRAAYCPSYYHMVVWASLLLAVFGCCVASAARELEVRYYEPFAARRPLIVWASAATWSVLVVEPLWAWQWALLWHMVQAYTAWDPIFKLRHQWLPAAWDGCVTRLIKCGCSRCMPGLRKAKYEEDDDESEEGVYEYPEPDMAYRAPQPRD